jgi:UDP-N-acetylglucosamine diphosphorylase / glucose-1-phosphate thymidylyltransferase / UDP-N-acetylgalactosamine diphosphorylase / glucosamine-1-phosphate N-acetyltransferase / galactosamine-1-phosphate N-acetyltransferase
MKALILAAGRGKRLNDVTRGQNKCMLHLLGKPLVQYSMDCAAKADVDEIVMVVGYRAHDVMFHFGDNFGGLHVRYVFQEQPRGLVNAMECARPAVGDSDFILFLGDEVLKQPRHAQMAKDFYAQGLFAVCGMMHEPDREQIRKTYAILQDDRTNRVHRLIEKPRNPQNNMRGTGNCIFRAEIFDYIDATPVSPARGEKELTDLIQCAVDDGRDVRTMQVASHYINLNTPDDIQKAEQEYLAPVEWVHTPTPVL